MNSVIITQRIEYLKKRNETVDMLDHKLIDFTIRCGLIPVLIPNNIYKTNLSNSKNYIFFKKWIRQYSLSGIILSGGNDIGEFKQRDNLEKLLIKYAKNHRIPLLGICRGMQLLSKLYGSNLKRVKNHIKSFHKISGVINQRVNSFHKYSILKCPKEFKITSTSSDGEIESIKHIYLPWEAWMWHPERNKNYNLKDIKRVKNLFNC